MSEHIPGTAELTLEMDAAADKDIGGREHDEDGFLCRPDLGLFAVADGAGGENAGNVASSIALSSLARHFEATSKHIREQPRFDRLGLAFAARRVSSAVHRANREVLEIARSSDRYRGMGTTVAVIAADLESSVVHVAHVGDSRCYRLRAGRLELVTTDHSLAQDVLELSPDIDDATQARLPQNVITRALGMSETVRTSVRSLDLALGDIFLLCTDGLTDVLSDEEIAETLLLTTNVRARAQGLVARAKAAPADDNVAVIVVRFDAPQGAAALPKRHATRPQPSKPPSAMPRHRVEGDSWHDPEIIVVESESPRSEDHAVHVLPKGAPPQMLSAFENVLLSRPRPSSSNSTAFGIPSRSRRPLDSTAPDDGDSDLDLGSPLETVTIIDGDDDTEH